MDLRRAFLAPLQDPHADEKLVMGAFFALLSLIPVIGWVALAVLLGWMVELVRGLQADKPHPLPGWVRLDEKLSLGAPLLVAVFVYNLPLILIYLVLVIVPGFFGGELATSGVSLLLLTCALPVVLGYTLAAWSMLAVAVADYAQTAETGSFYRVGHLWGVLQRRTPTVLTWAGMATVMNVVFWLIPCIGWLAALVLYIPAQGYLLGQLARLIHPADAPPASAA